MDPILSLAYSMYSNKGLYALLLGSGVSRSVGIPTGWEIVLDLITKIANMMGEDCSGDPVAWYRKKFNAEPDYSILLNEIAKTSIERSQILRSYFEPNDLEREQGIKIPTAAHRSIAKLIKEGFIRVVITTNFDRLLEKALEEVGVTPIVISTPDAVEGALPLVHSKCTVVKVHGDYLDTRMKNTVSELESYDERINKLLDRIFDEFGLIVCGWSAEWDTALRACIERCKNHRFPTYWACIYEPTEKAKKLIDLRCAQVISIKNADDFFSQLESKVLALNDIYKPHPLSSKVAVSILKRYLSDNRNKIYAHDLIMKETDRVCKELNSDKFNVKTKLDEQTFRERIRQYESLLEILMNLMITGCYWGSVEYADIWAKSIEQVANPTRLHNGLVGWLNLRYYPALLLLYAGGIASIASKNYHNLYALCIQAKCEDKNRYGFFSSLAKNIYPSRVIEDKSWAQKVFNMEGHYTPISDYLYNLMREPLRAIIPLDINYELYFDYFEYLLGLIYVDLNYDSVEESNRIWGPVGRFSWKYKWEPENSILSIISEEIRQIGNDWLPLKAGFFKRDLERFTIIKNKYDEFIKILPFY